MSAAPEYVITLVHGTWGRGVVLPHGDAEWTRDNSSFCHAIAVALTPHEVLFQRLRWSGRNSHRARLKAAGQLSELVGDLKLQYPKAHHVVVAHSHGGNVALYCLRKSDPRKQVDGIVCLSTHFINVHRRPLGPRLSIGLSFLTAFSFCA
jgi:triacylglycerol esterase/lipase EstA (alpha/beta hydrolase family)